MIVNASGDSNAAMHWTVTDFRNYIVVPYKLKLTGWPPEYTFQNPSKMRTYQLRTLLFLLSANQLCFVCASDREVADAVSNAATAAPGPLFPLPPPDYGRRNIGRRLPCYDQNGQLRKRRYERNGPKSAKSIEESETERSVGRSAAHRELSEDPISEFED